jgi:hypothetical protein
MDDLYDPSLNGDMIIVMPIPVPFSMNYRYMSTERLDLR